MSDKPILFSGPMVRALLAGTKTQTRRVLKAKPGKTVSDFTVEAGPVGEIGRRLELPVDQLAVPFVVGDRLYVREAWRTQGWLDQVPPRDLTPNIAVRYDADPVDVDNLGLADGKFRPGIHMPRWATRITLDVTDVRVQRLQEISEADARAEGIAPLPAGRYYCGEDDEGPITAKSPITAFGWLWNSINGKRPGCHWQDNPWVVAVSFEVQRGNIDQVPA